MEIEKAIIAVGGLGTRFLPLSKVLPKEFWPIVDKPIVQYIVEEIKQSGISQILFVISPDKKIVMDYFAKPNLQRAKQLKKILKDRKKIELLEDLVKLEDFLKDISFSHVFQKKPLGSGQAVLLAKDFVGNEGVAVLFGDDIVYSRIPCLLQLIKIFKTAQKPILALHRIVEERTPFYGIVETEKIANRLYKIKKIIEKPPLGQAPSNLAIVGKYILTPEVFNYLKKTKPLKPSGETVLTLTLDNMLKDGKMIYGYEFEGEWLECGNKLGFLETQICLALQHPEFGEKLKQFLKTLKI